MILQIGLDKLGQICRWCRGNIKLETTLGLLLFTISTAAMALAEIIQDDCEVYVVDVKAANKALKWPTAGEDTVTKVLGKFVPQGGEEVLTTKSYRLPNKNGFITASVFYTDESMVMRKKNSDIDCDVSMQLGIAVSNKATKDAIHAVNNATTEITRDQNTVGVRVKKFTKINGHLYLVGLECHCNGSQPIRQ